MTKNIVWIIVNHTHSKSQPGEWEKSQHTRLKYNTHIDLSCQIVAKRLRTSLFYP